MLLRRSSRFKRAYKKLPEHIKDDFDKQIKLFMVDPFNPSLKSHKLKGALQNIYSFYLRDGYRVFFDFVNHSEVELLYIGHHDSYRKLINQF